MIGTLEQVLDTKGTRFVHRVSFDVNVLESAQLMTDLGVGSLLVVDSQRNPIGIFTERDLVRRVVTERQDPSSIIVGKVMSQPVITVRPSTTVAAALEMCTEGRFRRLPIVEKRQLVGLLTLGDLTRWLVEQQRGQINELEDHIWGPQGMPG